MVKGIAVDPQHLILEPWASSCFWKRFQNHWWSTGGRQPWRKWSHRGSQFCWGLERLSGERGHAFGAHVAPKPWEYTRPEALIFLDAWTLSEAHWTKCLPSFSMISFKTSIMKAYNRTSLIFQHKTSKGDNINGTSMFWEKLLTICTHSLVQWLRIRLPMQGMQFSLWSRSHMPLNSCTKEPICCN